MSDLRPVINAFRRGEQKLAQLLDAFAAGYAQDPREAAQALDELKHLSGFPPQVIAEIEACLLPQTPIGPPPGDGTDAAKAATEDGARAAVPDAGGPTALDPAGAAHDEQDRRGAVPPPPEASLEDDAGETVVVSPPARVPRGEPKPPPEAPGEVTTGVSATHRTEDATTPSQAATTAGLSGASETTRHDYPRLAEEPEVHHVLRNRFRLDEILGRGGMGVVFKAWDLSREAVEFGNIEQNYVAIKLLNQSFKQNPHSVKVLGREFTNTQRLNHPNIIHLYDFDRDDRGNYFIAMELLQGDSLDKVIREVREQGGMPFARAFHLIEQMGSALAAAHNNQPRIIHSDFKPANVYVSTGDRVKVFDFGIARAARPQLGDGTHETTNFDPGSLGAMTPAYASLEMLLGDDPDPRDDIYALAIVSYELLTGRRPFGRKTTALRAREKHLEPPPITSLDPRQWQGLQRGLAFERAQRSQTIEQFIDELRPPSQPSPQPPRPRWRRPLAMTAGVIGAGTLSWFLGLAPWLEQRQEDAILEKIGTAQPAELGALLARAAALSEPARTHLTAAVVTQLADLVGSDDAAVRERARTGLATLPNLVQAQVFERVSAALAPGLKADPPALVLKRLALIMELPEGTRAALLAGAADPIRNALLAEARAAFAPEAERYDYARAKNLLDQADRLFHDSKAIFDERIQLDGRYEKFKGNLDERITALREQGVLLPVAGRDSLPALLAILKQIDGQYPKYAYLANSYYSAAKTAEATDLDAARAYVETGLTLFPDSSELKNQQSRLEDLARTQTQAQAIAALQRRVKTALAALDDAAPTGPLVEDLRTLRAANPKDPLLTEAAGRAEKALRPTLQARLAARDWAGAQALLERYTGMAEAGFLAAQNQAVADALAALEARIAKLDAAFQERLGARDLSGAEAALTERAALAPGSEALTQAGSELIRAYLARAREARAAGHWDEARGLVEQALTRVSDAQLKGSLQEERVAIDDAESASRRQLAEAERARLEAERAGRIAAIGQEFSAFVDTMGTSEKDVSQARGLLDRLAGLAPEDPLLQSGLSAIAARFSAAAGREAAAGHWDQALALVRTGQRLLPGVTALDQELERLTAGARQAQTQRQSIAIATQEEAVAKLLTNPDFTPAGASRLGAALAELSRLTAADPTRPGLVEERINTLYGQRLTELGQQNLFAEGRTLLEQWATLVPRAEALQGQARAALDAAFNAWEQTEGERKRLAEVEANKQSLLTQAKADQPEKALTILEQLRARLGAGDPFVNREAPQAIAETYVRLARQSAKRGSNATALKLLDKATGLDPQAAVGGLRAEIERNLAHDRLSAQIGSADAAGLANLADALQSLEAIAADDYPRWEQEWIKTLTNRVKTTLPPAAAERLRKAALTLFPNAPALVQVEPPTPAAPEPPPPAPLASPLLDDVRAALADHRLSAAERALTQARAQLPGNPDLRQVEQMLSTAKAAAADAYRRYDSLRPRGPATKTEEARKIACQLWTDNNSWQPLCQGPRPGPSPALQRQEPCNPRYAGFGNTKKARCADTLNGDIKGPELVVVPPGSGNAKPFAMTRYEISVGEFDLYCASTKECAQVAGRSPKLPVTGITVGQAEQYAAWLSRLTGATYRLPRSGEWEQAARAKGDPPNGATNCLLRDGGQIVKGGAPDLVSTGVTNSWGLVNAIGNVQEWTRDGETLQAHGGHYANDAGSCSVTLVTGHSGKPDAYTGFRLVKEIGG